jgi:hypothetical protein
MKSSMMTPCQIGANSCQHPKLIEKGDASFSTTKKVLGWDLNMATMTLALPPSRLQSLQDSILPLLRQCKTSVRKWRKLIGILCSITATLYGGVHLFSILQCALFTVTHNRIMLKSLLKV